MERKAFTVAEANALIPHLSEVLSRIREEAFQLQARRDRLQLLDVLWGEKVWEASNPDHEEAVGLRQRARVAAERIEGLLREEILDRGIRFPSGGLEHGLLDFPTTWDGRWVYLCWRSGESAVSAWHEVDGGYRGRRPLTPEQVRRMGSDDGVGRPDDGALDF